MCCARRGGHGLRLVRWGEVGGWADVVVRVTTLLGLAILYKPLHIFLLLGKLLWWWAAVILLYCVLFM